MQDVSAHVLNGQVVTQAMLRLISAVVKQFRDAQKTLVYALNGDIFSCGKLVQLDYKAVMLRLHIFAKSDSLHDDFLEIYLLLH